MAGRADLAIYQGDDYAATVTVSNPDGTAANLAGYVAEAQIRAVLGDTSASPVASLACAISGSVVSLSLTHDQTKAFTSAGYVWDLQLISPSGWITTILAGQVWVTLEVTKLYSLTAQQGVLEHAGNTEPRAIV